MHSPPCGRTAPSKSGVFLDIPASGRRVSVASNAVCAHGGSREGSPEEELIIVDHLPVFATERARKKFASFQPGIVRSARPATWACRPRARRQPKNANDSLKAPMIITMERLAHFPGAAASRPRAAFFPSHPACERPFSRAHARDSSPAPRSLRGPLAPPRFSPRGFPNYIQSLVSLSVVTDLVFDF